MIDYANTSRRKLKIKEQIENEFYFVISLFLLFVVLSIVIMR